jgi:hypothetical protein
VLETLRVLERVATQERRWREPLACPYLLACAGEGGGVGVATQGRQGVKLFDYLDWCEIAKLMIDGKHLTVEGLEIIRSIKSGMNTGRKINNN